MRSLYLLLAMTVTLSVTTWAQTRTADVDFAYSATPGLLKTAKGHAHVAVKDDARVLQFQVNGKTTDSIDLDNNVMGAIGKIENLRIISFTDYSARATAEERRGLFDKRMPEISFFKPVVVLQEAGKVHLYTVSQQGRLTQVFAATSTDVSLLRVGLKDRDGILNYIDMDLFKIGSGEDAVYYSPELKGVVNKNQIVIVKRDHSENELSTQELLALRAIDPAAADRYEAAEKAMRESRYVYTTPSERNTNTLTLSRLVLGSDPSDALIERRIHARNLALQGKVIAQSEKFSLLKNTGERFRDAVSTARRLLNGKIAACPNRLTRSH